MTAYVYGVGSSAFGKQPERRWEELAWQAVHEAFTDAGIRRVDAVFVGTVFGPPGVAQRVLRAAGITEVPVITIENACASGTSAYHEAATAVSARRYEHVLALGVEHMTSSFTGAIHPEWTDGEGRTGLALPALYAMSAHRYQSVYGLTDAQLALVSVKNHQHGAANSRAQYRRECSLEEVLASPRIADPLTLLQCCPIADGAAAAVLGPARGVSRDVRVRASALRAGASWGASSSNVWGYDLVAATATEAYEQAGLGVADLDVLEVHDAFTIGEIVTLEALGLADVGMGGQLAESRRTWLGGPQPVNPSGGLLSRGHPLGCTGLAQVAEVVWQLRGEAGERQRPDARIGLVETMGGGVAGLDGNGCVVTVLERSA